VTFTATARHGAPASLVYRQQPTDAAPLTTITPPVAVAVEDRLGNTTTGYSSSLTVAIAPGSGTPGASLSGTLERTPVNGVATFDDLRVSLPGVGYRLQVTTGPLAQNSGSFDVIAPAPSPSSVERVSGNGQSDTVAAALSEPYVVRVTDSGGSPVSGVEVAWQVVAGGGSVAPSSSSTNSAGLAATSHRFGISIGDQTVSAAVAGLGGSPVMFISTATHGAPAQLVFRRQPSDVAPLFTIVPPVEVAVLDRVGNTATGFLGSITMGIAPGSGTPGAALSGTVAREVAEGVAAFPDLSIALVGLAYRLRATTSALTEDSAPFNVLLP
jgi:hypothetical protein